MKYGFDDVRNVLERASARETAARVAIGCALQGVPGGARDPDRLPCRPDREGGGARVEPPPGSRGPRRRGRLAGAVLRRGGGGDGWSPRSIASGSRGTRSGGVFEVLAYGCPPGLGSHVHYDRKLDARLALGADEHPVGEGRGGRRRASRPPRAGSKAHDEIVLRDGGSRAAHGARGRDRGRHEHRAADPRASGDEAVLDLPKPLATVDLATGEAAVAIKQRTDVCAVPAGGVVGEAVVAFVLADAVAREVRRGLAPGDPAEPGRATWGRSRDRLPRGHAGSRQVHRGPGARGAPRGPIRGPGLGDRAGGRGGGHRHLRETRARLPSARWRLPPS